MYSQWRTGSRVTQSMALDTWVDENVYNVNNVGFFRKEIAHTDQ